MIAANEEELVSQAGKPTDANFRDWFVAASFLKYTSALHWVRVVDEQTAMNATAGGSAHGILIKNTKHLEVVRSVSNLSNYFAAKCPGVLGNSIAVSIADAATFTNWDYAHMFDSAPNSSGSLSNNVAPALDEVHVVVIDQGGLFSGVPGSVLETYAYLSKAADAVDVNGASSYYVNKLNNSSSYVWGLAPISGADTVDNTSGNFSAIGKKLTDGKPFVAFSAVYHAQFTAGADGDTPGKIKENVENLNSEEPVEEPTEEPTEEPVSEPTEEPVDEPVEEPTEEDKGALNDGEVPTEEPRRIPCKLLQLQAHL
jgi:hypothetical protein